LVTITHSQGSARVF